MGSVIVIYYIYFFYIRFCLYCRTRKMLQEDWITFLDKKINIITIIWITVGISIMLWFHSTSMICTSHVRIQILRKGVVHSYVVAHLHYLRTSKERSRDSILQVVMSFWKIKSQKGGVRTSLTPNPWIHQCIYFNWFKRRWTPLIADCAIHVEKICPENENIRQQQIYKIKCTCYYYVKAHALAKIFIKQKEKQNDMYMLTHLTISENWNEKYFV